jgi:phosphoribosylglycinamide formyltransferase-1
VTLTKPEKSNPVSNRRLGVLISGRGSNLQALIDAIAERRLDATIAVVISNVEDAEGLARARAAGIEALCLSHRGWPSRDDYDRALAAALTGRQVGLVCLAGFMRRIGRPLIDAFPHAIVNVHPSLLPSFPGTEAQRRALEHGVRISGVTVHLVTEELDAGPIVLQRAVGVRGDDTPEVLAARILVEEHQAYPEAVQLLLSGDWTVEGRRFVTLPGAGAALPARLPAGN